MYRLPTVVLRHTTREGSHYDWLLADPRAPRGLLWAARMAAPPRDWPALRHWPITLLPPHRRRYLTYEGPLSRHRGRVRRVDAGWFLPLLWTPRRRVLFVAYRGCTATVEMRPETDSRWQATLIGARP